MYISLIESLGIHTTDQLYELFTTKQHGIPISCHRAAIMQSRVFFLQCDIRCIGAGLVGN